LSLSPAHIARIHKAVEDAGPPAGVEQQTDADYADWVVQIAASHPTPGRSTQLFAYGSLIWKPEIEHTSEQRCTATSFLFAEKRLPRPASTPPPLAHGACAVGAKASVAPCFNSLLSSMSYSHSYEK
jgi:hypothetical protein